VHIASLTWGKCGGNVWCNLLTLNLDHPYFSAVEGVYIIWHGGANPRVVYVGEGVIADRLRAHRTDARILKYGMYGIFVTWATVGPSMRPGVERFLADHFRPLVGDRVPNAEPISVNSPW